VAAFVDVSEVWELFTCPEEEKKIIKDIILRVRHLQLANVTLYNMLVEKITNRAVNRNVQTKITRYFGNKK